jgi:16S rRNA C967 or C1407 C5-methylase (RsmB/RsmF family)
MMNEKFENYFSKIHSNWPELREVLLQDEKQVGFSSFDNSLEEVLKNPEKFPVPTDTQKRTSDGFIEKYVLDPASLLPVYALNLQKDSHVLDLCAAPGGKSLAILGQIPQGHLTANDSSKDRFLRLKKVLKEYSPPATHQNFETTLGDGRTFFKTKKTFGRVLVDVPCSSERHLLKNEKFLKTWTPKQAETLAVKQYTLLCTALLCAEPNATIVYSTCSINPVENDEVIAKVLKKKADQCQLDLPDLEFLGAQKTDYGYWILPSNQGFGPIYLSRLKRT